MEQTKKTIVGLFDDRSEAHRVVRELLDDGFSREDISILAKDMKGHYADEASSARTGEATKGAGRGAAIGGLAGVLIGLGTVAVPGIGTAIAAGPLAKALAGAGVGAAAGGVIGALTNVGLPQEQAGNYAEGVRRGGTLVLVDAPQDKADRAASIMDRHGVVNIDKRVERWRRSGWNGFNPNADGELTLQVIEEELAVGKHEIERGGVRVYTRVTEKPVEKTIPLREERIRVERRPVDRPATEADLNAFKEGTIEVTEVVEEPVVTKRARVVEEVVIKKDVKEHTETVRDTVRRADVQVEPLASRKEEPSGSRPTVERRDFQTYEADFRKDFENRFANKGYTYEHYAPAYRYGYNLATDERSGTRDWVGLESEARRVWEEQNPGSWDQYKESVRYAWDRVRGQHGDLGKPPESATERARHMSAEARPDVGTESHRERGVLDSERLRDQARRIGLETEPLTSGQRTEPAGFEAYDADFRKNFESTFASRGYSYDRYAPAYRYGYNMGTDKRFSKADWATVEPEARLSWEKSNAGTWEQFKDAVRYAWDKVRGRR